VELDSKQTRVEWKRCGVTQVVVVDRLLLRSVAGDVVMMTKAMKVAFGEQSEDRESEFVLQ